MRHKQLLWFPVLSALSTAVIVVSFLLPVYVSGGLGPLTAMLNKGDSTSYALWFIFYCVHHFIIIFFNSALVGAAGRSLAGEPATVNDGLRMAGNRIGRIAYWAVFATTVSVLLSAFRRRAGAAGRAASGVLGVAWSLVTYFIVPVLVFEDRPVLESIDRSMALCRKAWGEEASSGIGFGLIWLLASAPALIWAYLSFKSHSITGLVGAALYLMMLSTVSSATKGIFTTALYRYAAQSGPNWFSNDLLSGALAGGNGTLFDAAGDEPRPALDASLIDVKVMPLEKGLDRGELYIMRIRAGGTEYHASYPLGELEPGFRADSWESGTPLELRINGDWMEISGPGCAGLRCHFTTARASYSI
jgi:hypothetical protein